MPADATISTPTTLSDHCSNQTPLKHLDAKHSADVCRIGTMLPPSAAIDQYRPLNSKEHATHAKSRASSESPLNAASSAHDKPACWPPDRPFSNDSSPSQNILNKRSHTCWSRTLPRQWPFHKSLGQFFCCCVAAVSDIARRLHLKLWQAGCDVTLRRRPSQHQQWDPRADWSF